MFDGICDHQTIPLPVLRHIGQTVLDSLGNACQSDRFAVDQCLSGYLLPVGTAKDRHRQLRAACADEPRQADHFTVVDLERHIVDDLFIRVQRMMDCPVLDLKSNIPAGNGPSLREPAGHFTPDHALDNARLGYLVRLLIQRFDGFSVAQNGDAVRAVFYFI